jgi:cytochrome c oxidase subunit 2
MRVATFARRLASMGSIASVQASASQSVHDPASAAAQQIHLLGLAMYAVGAGLSLLVIVLVLKAVLQPPRPVRGDWVVLAGGIVLPVTVLTVLLVASLLIGNALARPAGLPVARIQVIGHQWWWEVRYLPPAEIRGELAQRLADLCGGVRSSSPPQARPAGQEAIVTANEIRIPAGHAVELELYTNDVIHSFWVPALGGTVDMIPGRMNRLAWQAERPGVYRGQCAEFCGGPHGMMGLVVIAQTPEDYRAWLERQAAPARKPATAELQLGQAALLGSRCAECHTVRGTAARGGAGPDLTHVGGRRTLAAATLDNHVGTLAGWIADPQQVKPGNAMPPADTLTGSELRALAAYLASLE